MDGGFGWTPSNSEESRPSFGSLGRFWSCLSSYYGCLRYYLKVTILDQRLVWDRSLPTICISLGGWMFARMDIYDFRTFLTFYDAAPMKFTFALRGLPDSHSIVTTPTAHDVTAIWPCRCSVTESPASAQWTCDSKIIYIYNNMETNKESSFSQSVVGNKNDFKHLIILPFKSLFFFYKVSCRKICYIQEVLYYHCTYTAFY